MTPKDIGALVRQARLRAGMTQARLGERIGASRFWVAQFERGKPGAELGLALKALRALQLTVTIEPQEVARPSLIRETRQQPTGDSPVSLDAILRTTALPAGSGAPDPQERHPTPASRRKTRKP